MGVSVQSWQRNEGKMKIQILGLIFVGMLPFLVSGTAKAKDGHIMRFGRSEGDLSDKERSMKMYRFGRSEKDQVLRFGRSEKDQVLRFGRSPKDQISRFGRLDSEYDKMWKHLSRFGRSGIGKNKLMRFGR